MLVIVKIFRMFLIGGGTTFFVIFAIRSKFAKEVGKRIADHRRARRRKIIQDALCELYFHARMYKKHKNAYMALVLKGKALPGLLKRDNEVRMDLERERRNKERIESKRCWDFLAAYGKFPVNMTTKRRWNEFEDFLHWVLETEEVEELCA